MSIRRMMLFTLGCFFKSIISLFKTRVLSDGGNFEAETNLENQLNTLGSDLFNSASLVVTPNGVKTSKLYAIKPDNGSGDLTVTRATTATRVNESGVIVDVPANVARIDYSTGQPAILAEPQRTNLVFPSNIATTQVIAVTAQVYTLSFYGSGTVTLSGVFSGSLVGTGSNNRVSLTFTPTAGNLTLTVSGTVTDWQLEAGSNATSYIPTTTSAVTRNADVISKSGIYTNNFITSYGGSFFIDLSKNIVNIRDAVGGGIWLNDSGNAAIFGSGFGIRNSSSGNRRVSIFKIIEGAGSTIYQTLTDNVKILIKWNGATMDVFVNGAKVVNATSFTPTLMDYFIASANRTFNINDISMFPTPITYAQAIQLTTL